MKAKLIPVLIFLTAVSAISVIGCKYEVAEPKWYDGNIATVDPIVTQVLPTTGAVPGVNYITINGQNFCDSISQMKVFFNAKEAEIISLSPTQIIVRRPNVVDVASKLQISSMKAYLVVNAGLYRVDNVLRQYSSFLEGTALGAMAFSGDTMYIIPANNTTPATIWKVTPDEVKTTITLTGTGRNPYSACARNNVLYWLNTNTNRVILQVNLSTRVISNWTQLPAGKIMRYGDFGSNGYFYAGGLNTDLCIIPPNPPSTVTPTYAGAYNAEEILAVRVSNGYVYVASRTVAAPAAKIYRHLIGTGSAIGTRELVVDLGLTEFASRLVKAINISSTGTLYITTDAPNPLLIYDGTKVDYFYKDIISHTEGTNTSYWLGKFSYWGNKNELFMIGNDSTSSAQVKFKWNILKIDMGTAGTPYY